jgi:hypothetical protein
MYEENERLIKGSPTCIYDVTQRAVRVTKYRVPKLDPTTKQEVDKDIYFDPPLSQLGLEVSQLRPKYHNMFQASFETAIWCEGEKAADAMNNALKGRMDLTMALGLHGQTIPIDEHIDSLSNVKTHVLFGDNDEPGVRVMDNLERHINALLPQAAVARVKHPEGAEPKSDAHDYGPQAVDLVEEAMGTSTIQEAAEVVEVEAAPYRKRKPKPVEKEHYIGLIGEAVERLDEHTEATREAMFMTLLTGICPLLGPYPHIGYPLNATPNIFTCIVGPQNSGRKGTSWNVIEHSFLKKMAKALNPNDDDWTSSRATSVDSGQGIINLVSGGKPDRLFVIQEFKALFDAANRDGSTVDSVLRQAYDRDSLQVNRARDTLRQDHANISFVTHITPADLTAETNNQWSSNGFFRRWDWVYSESDKEVNGFQDEDLTLDLVDRLVLAIEYGRKYGSVKFTPEAWDYWAQWRRSIQSDEENFISKATTGHESRVSRIALVLALIDEAAQADLPALDRTLGESLEEGPTPHQFSNKEIVGVEHIKAAIRWNQYSVDSLECVFHNRRFDYFTQKVLEALEENKELTLTQIQTQVLKGNKLKVNIAEYGKKLEAAGLIRRIMRRKEGNTVGRKAEVWIYMGPTN